MSKTQIEEQKRFIEAEKAKQKRKVDPRKRWHRKLVEQEYDPAHLII